jgi:hypothetical protein
LEKEQRAVGLHKAELHNLFDYLSNIIRVNKSNILGWATYVSWAGKTENEYKILFVKSEDNIKMDL